MGERICTQRSHDYVDQHTRDGVLQCVHIGIGDVASVQQRAVTPEVDAPRDEGDLTAQHQVRIAHGHDQHVHQREQDQDEKERQQCIIDCAKDPVSDALADSYALNRLFLCSIHIY